MPRRDVWRHFWQLGSFAFLVLMLSVASAGAGGEYAAEGQNGKALAAYALAGLAALVAVASGWAFARQLRDYRRAAAARDETERQVNEWLDRRRRPVPWGRREPE